MTKTKVTLELTVSEGTRVRGWGDDAVYEYIVRHDKLTGEMRFRCNRKSLTKILDEMGASIELQDDDGDVSLLDVGNELSRASTGIPLSEFDQQELQDMVSPKRSQNQVTTAFKIKLG